MTVVQDGDVVENMAIRKKEMRGRIVRDSVFQAAQEIFQSSGWRGFTMAELAQRVGVSKGTIYNYFTDKGDVLLFIFHQIFEHNCKELRSFMTREPATGPRLRWVVRNHLAQAARFSALRRALVEMMMVEEQSRDSINGDLRGNTYRALVTEIIRQGQSEGQVRSGDVEIMGEILWHCLAGLCTMIGCDDGRRMPVETVADEGYRLLMEGLISREVVHGDD